MSRSTDPVTRRLLILGVVSLTFAALLYLFPYAERLYIRLSAEPRAVTPRGALAADERTTIEIFEQSSPSVVYITTLSRVVDYWTRDITEVQRGTGSGFIWDDLGHVVTNYHVLKGAGAAQVRLNDHRAFNAALVGASPEHDLAVLRIDVPYNIPRPLNIGASGDLLVGQKVFAIGNPFGLDYSLTTGIISALDRTIRTDDKTEIEHLIQTDAAINPGNSGGPLIDSAGRLIGVNTAIFSPSGAYAGIGFAVPVDTVNRVVPQLIAYGQYQRPSLGIMVADDISEAVTEQLGVPGLLVLQVNPGSAAERAGLQGSRWSSDGKKMIPGDVIQAIGEQPISNVDDLTMALDRHQVGDDVLLQLYRNGSVRKVRIVLMNRG